jgi:hypothetical protein
MTAVSTQHFPSFLKRINVYYLSTENNTNDLTIKTVPAYNDFYVPNITSV